MTPSSAESLLANGRPYVSATELAAAAVSLHRELTDAAGQIPRRHLHDEFSDRDRTLAEQLGHLAEDRDHIARHIDQWLRRERTVIGRPDGGDADLHDAVLRATRADQDQLLGALAEASDRLERTLGQLDDDHLRATIHHVALGREPLASYLTRTVLAHGRQQLAELRATLEDLAREEHL